MFKAPIDIPLGHSIEPGINILNFQCRFTLRYPKKILCKVYNNNIENLPFCSTIPYCWLCSCNPVCIVVGSRRCLRLLNNMGIKKAKNLLDTLVILFLIIPQKENIWHCTNLAGYQKLVSGSSGHFSTQKYQRAKSQGWE